jgi:hypothetical protein
MSNLAKKNTAVSTTEARCKKQNATSSTQHASARANVPGAVGSVCTTGHKQLGSPFVRLVLHELSGHVVVAP